MTKIKVKPEYQNNERWKQVTRAAEEVQKWSNVKKRARVALRPDNSKTSQ